MEAMPQHCPRCEATLPWIDESPSAFCPACGLPQLRVSDEFLERSGTPDPQVARISAPASDAAALDWPFALRVLAGTAFLGLIPCVLLPGAVASGGAGILVLVLLPLLCLGSGTAYLRRRPQRRLSAGTGARMGTALGLLLATVLAVSSGIAGFILRYGSHSRMLETSLNAAILRSELQVRASSPAPPPQNLFALLQSPDGHAGTFLLIQLMIFILLLVAGTVCGAVAGALLGARQRRARQS